jgi:hypothetical protein
MQKYKTFFFFLFLISCDTDEEAPLQPTNIRGYYTMAQSNPRIHMAWNYPMDDDIQEYHIFRSINNGVSFDYLDKVFHPNNFYEDTSIAWLDDFGYKIRAKDNSGNIGSFSDSIFINCFKPGGNWMLSLFDSLYICIDPLSYQTQEMFQVILSNNLETVTDTIKIMDFPSVQLDTNSWTANGWMYLTYMTLEISSDSVNYDTVTYSNTVAPEYFTIELNNPALGIISFSSETYNNLELMHSLKGCDGEALFP